MKSNKLPKWKQYNNNNNNGSSGNKKDFKEAKINPIEVVVFKNNIEQALKVLKNKMSKEGILQDLKNRRSAEKPSEKKRRKQRDALKRARKSKGKVRKFVNKPRSKVFSSVPIEE